MNAMSVFKVQCKRYNYKMMLRTTVWALYNITHLLQTNYVKIHYRDSGKEELKAQNIIHVDN